jgi:hypothetical protein
MERHVSTDEWHDCTWVSFLWFFFVFELIAKENVAQVFIIKIFCSRIETTFLFYRAKSIIATAILLISPQQLPPLHNICASYKQIIVMVAVSIVAFIIVVFSLYRLYRRCRCCIHHRSSRYTTIFGCNFCNSSPPTINLNWFPRVRIIYLIWNLFFYSLDEIMLLCLTNFVD